jgi:hypothetical protein
MTVRVLLVIAFALLAAAAGAADVYRWVDAEGKVHFSDSPPPGVAAEKLGIKSAPTDPTAVDLAESERQVRENHEEADAIVAANAGKEAAAKAEQKAKDCEGAKARYEAVQHSRKFATKDKDGKDSWMSGDDADKMKQKLKDDVTAKCGG